MNPMKVNAKYRWEGLKIGVKGEKIKTKKQKRSLIWI